MRRLTHSYIDERLRWPHKACVHCGMEPDAENVTKEHIPSKCLLIRPYPQELMTLTACRNCNGSYSHDEEYMAALLAAVLAGSTDSGKQVLAGPTHMFETKPSLRAKIEEAKTESRTLFGETEISFAPELERIERVVVKNARCHVVYDLDQWMPSDPDYALAVPLLRFSNNHIEEFESVQAGHSGWTEVGTRMFQRECFAFGPDEGDMTGPWVVVQDGVYRYTVVDTEQGLLVRSILHEYLATEVFWNMDEGK